MRLIDANALIAKIPSKMDMQNVYLPVHFIEWLVADAPTIDAVPVKHGCWLPYEFCTNGTYHKCSVCGVAHQYRFGGLESNHKYCPNCGADMRGTP